MELRSAVQSNSPFDRARRDYRWTYSDFRALECALAEDDIDRARDAFARLQDDSEELAQLVSHHPFPEDNPRLRAIKNLGRALIDGNLGAAKLAFNRFA